MRSRKNPVSETTTQTPKLPHHRNKTHCGTPVGTGGSYVVGWTLLHEAETKLRPYSKHRGGKKGTKMEQCFYVKLPLSGCRILTYCHYMLNDEIICVIALHSTEPNEIDEVKRRIQVNSCG